MDPTLLVGTISDAEALVRYAATGATEGAPDLVEVRLDLVASKMHRRCLAACEKIEKAGVQGLAPESRT
jgi:hypothetical protein